MDNKLRYRIDSWDKLTQCLSNNSRDLSISVSKCVSTDVLDGTLISVEHPSYGCLFSCLVNASGSLISEGVDCLTTPQILKQLEMFGFYIEFASVVDISLKQLMCLRACLDMGFNKVRVLSVWQYTTNASKIADTHIVAFDDSHNSDWLNNGYSPNIEEFSSAIQKGYATNLDNATSNLKFNWSWLYGNVMNIEDILSSHSYEMSSYEVH